MDNYKEEVDRICKAIARLYKEQLTADKAVATGRLRDSVDNFTHNYDDVVKNGGHFELYFNLEHYWKYAPEGEYKTKYKHPSKKMVESIKEWIEAKHLDLNEYAVSYKILKEGWDRQPRENLDKVMHSFDFDILVDELETVLFHQMTDEIMDKMLNNL